jgi:hypothetical protein
VGDEIVEGVGRVRPGDAAGSNTGEAAGDGEPGTTMETLETGEMLDKGTDVSG